MIWTVWADNPAQSALYLTPATAVGPRLKKGCRPAVETPPLEGSNLLTDTARGGRDAASPAAFCFIDKGSRPDAEQVRELGEKKMMGGGVESRHA